MHQHSTFQDWQQSEIKLYDVKTGKRKITTLKTKMLVLALHNFSLITCSTALTNLLNALFFVLPCIFTFD